MEARSSHRECAHSARIQSAFRLSRVARLAGSLMYPTLEHTVGNTPLVRLQRMPGATSNAILAKLEGNNPAGSVKDRPALSMLVEAEKRGEIKPGDTLVEALSLIHI